MKLGDAATLNTCLAVDLRDSTQWDGGLPLPKRDKNQKYRTSFAGARQMQQRLQDDGRGG